MNAPQKELHAFRVDLATTASKAVLLGLAFRSSAVFTQPIYHPGCGSPATNSARQDGRRKVCNCICEMRKRHHAMIERQAKHGDTSEMRHRHS